MVTFTIALFTTTSALHYELALLNEKDVTNRKRILGTSNFIVLISSILVATGVVLHYELNVITDFLLILVAAISLGLVTVVTAYYVTESNHEIINRSKLSYSVVSILMPLLLYYSIEDSFRALLISYSTAQLIHILILSRGIWSTLSFRPSGEIFKKFIAYPKFSVLGSFVNSFVNNGPVILVGQFYSESITGLFAIVSKLTQQPIRIISQSGMQVLSSLIAKEVDSQTFNLVKRLSRFLSILVASILLLLLFILIAVNEALILSIVLALLAQSLSTASVGVYGSYINYFGLQREELNWTILLLFGMLACVIVPYSGSTIYMYCFITSVAMFAVHQLKARRFQKLISVRID